MSAAMKRRVVVFEETGEEREVAAGCDRCGAEEWEHHVIVSPTGRAHYSADYGMTRCGIDATGDRWWWPV